jgi:hypothetical protein
MMKLDAITLEFARQVIEDETGTPLEIGVKAVPAEAAHTGTGETRLIARDDKKNPLISTFEWTDDAAHRVLRVPAGFMRNKTQERIEELARERAATTIDLALVEEGIEIGKKMMAEMIATYQGPPSTAPKPAAPTPSNGDGNGSGYLNEVSPLNALGASEQHKG